MLSSSEKETADSNNIWPEGCIKEIGGNGDDRKPTELIASSPVTVCYEAADWTPESSKENKAQFLHSALTLFLQADFVTFFHL